MTAFYSLTWRLLNAATAARSRLVRQFAGNGGARKTPQNPHRFGSMDL
jgi:hypothetical protein